MTKRFKDFYGCTAKLTTRRDGTARLVTKTPSGRLIRNATYKSEKAARSVMGRDSDGWEEVS